MIFAVHRGMMERYNISVGFTLYGSTEGVINTMNRFTLPISDKFESVELPLSSICGRVNSEFCEIMIADENTREVPYGTEGEILVRSRKPHVMFEGYYGMPEKTVEAFRSFWYHTGDRGFIDREGILYFCGRMAEGIKVKGEWVATLELEMLFRRHPKVFDCAVVGFPAELVDEDIKIYIQLKEGESMAPEEVIAYCEGKIARFMIPRYIEFVKEFPRAFADKIQKVELKKRGIGKCWDREKGWL
jgi:crotonobetaine/carnitine-CoA ligase